MKKAVNLSLRDPKVFLLTFGGIGFIPFAPGTLGTLAVIPFLIAAFIYQMPLVIYLFILAALTIVSTIAAERAQQFYSVHDPSWIVIDEVIGMATTWVFISAISWHQVLLAFVLFRFFDIIKIWPASYFDNKVVHGIGTIGDDLVSGIYAGITCLLIYKVIPLLA